MIDAELFFANVTEPQRFRDAIRRFDEANSADPNTERADGRDWPRELLYARRLCAWVMRLCPTASEALRLAARSQHLCRWTIPRDSYERTRAGYLKWRTDLKAFHARRSGEILRNAGYPEPVVARMQALNLKKDFPADAESRVLEDALCLVFLEFQLADLAGRTAEDKVIQALQKSWKKMTPAAQAEVMKLPLGPREAGLLRQALNAKPEGESECARPFAKAT
ncbi:MAG: DUF4202 domain-containing protein [Verrucomicrobia bacterium]|nr:DUF4202 domain-containing protein [Verrucomicrobiota bacterium]